MNFPYLVNIISTNGKFDLNFMLVLIEELLNKIWVDVNGLTYSVLTTSFAGATCSKEAFFGLFRLILCSNTLTLRLSIGRLTGM